MVIYMKDSLDTKLYNDYLNGNKEAFELLYNKYEFKNYIYLVARSKALNYINVEKRRSYII